MKNKLIATLAAIPFAVAGVFNASVTNAVPIIQFDDQSVDGGLIKYDGEGGSLIGENFKLDIILGIDTPDNNRIELNCEDCVLNFETGANISESPYIFALGGSVTIEGTVKDDLNNTIASGTLVSGSFTEDIIGFASNFNALFSAAGINNVNADISSFFGFKTTEFTFAQTSIALGDDNVDFEKDGGFTAKITNVDFDNIPISTVTEKVPEPSTLLGLGLVTAGLINVSRRQSKKSS